MAGSPVWLYRNYSASDTTYLELSSHTDPLPTVESLGWLAPSGYMFKEWNSKRDGTGMSFEPGTAYPLNESNKYAIWEQQPTNYLTTDTELTSIADAIRTKGGTSASLIFPAGFVSAINAIPTGGGGETHTVELQTDMKVLDWDTLTLVSTSPQFYEGQGIVIQYTGPFLSYDMVRTDTQETIPKIALRTGSTGVYAYVMPDSDIQPFSDEVKP